MTKKQNVKELVEQFTNEVMDAKEKRDNMVDYYAKTKADLEQEYNDMSATKNDVAVNGTENEFLTLCDTMQKNINKRELCSIRSQAVINDFDNNKQSYVKRYNDINKANHVEALKKCLPHLEALRQITDEAYKNREALDIVRGLIAKNYEGINVVTPEKSVLDGIAKDVNDIRLERVREALKDGSK